MERRKSVKLFLTFFSLAVLLFWNNSASSKRSDKVLVQLHFFRAPCELCVYTLQAPEIQNATWCPYLCRFPANLRVNAMETDFSMSCSALHVCPTPDISEPPPKPSLFDTPITLPLKLQLFIPHHLISCFFCCCCFPPMTFK